MDKKGNTYLYCVIKVKKSRSFSIEGMDGATPYTIGDGKLAVVVSDTPRENYDFIREHLLAHQKVIEYVMRSGYDVLPVRFGTVAKASTDIEEKLLRARAQELVDEFKIVEGRTELGVRAIWKDMPRVFQEIVAEYPEIQKAKVLAQKNPIQFRVAAVGELVKRALDAKRAQEAKKIAESLGVLAVDTKERDLLAEAMILSSAFLVSKAKEKVFDEQVRKLEQYGAGKGIMFKYFGPIPAYNFVEIHLHI